MAQEEQNQRCSSSSNSGGGGGGACGRGSRVSNSKKLKQKKIPQRGLGVEKLEKIRLEEQWKNGIAATRPVVLLPLHNPLSSTATASPPYRRSSSSSFPPPPPPPHHHHPDFFTLPPPLLATNSSTLHGYNNNNNNNFVSPTCGRSGSNGSVMGWSEGGGAIIRDGGYGCLTSTWNIPSFDLEVPSLDSEFRIGMNSQSDLRLNLPFTVPIPREPPQHHQHHCQKLSSMVNVSSSTSSSSGQSLQMEPPSNQSFYSNYGPPLWPEEEKMVGMKRPWPFSLDNPPGSSSKFHTTISNLGHRQDESSSSSSFGNKNIGTLSFDLGNAAIFREAYSSSNAHYNPARTEYNKENVGLDGDSLTLGLSTTTTSSSSTTLKSKQPMLFPSSQKDLKRGVEDSSIEPGSSDQERPVYSFFPLKKQQTVHVHGMSNERRGDAGGIDVDLTLKL